MRKKILIDLGLLCFVMVTVGCMAYEPLEVREKMSGKGLPVIHQSFASNKIRPGDPWKVYLKASHPDGGMKNIVCVIEQPGMGTYPLSFTKIKEENKKDLSGYIYLNTLSSEDLTYVTIKLTVQIQDLAGHYSQPVVLPLSFDKAYKQDPPPEGIFAEKELGPILITLRTSRDHNPQGA